MLRTNSRKAVEIIHGYITDNFTPENYTDKNFSDFFEIAAFILNTFRSEKYSDLGDFRYYNGNEDFTDWCSGLPSLLDTCYYYNCSAIDDLATILEQTETEKARYTDESKAEELLTALIYRELRKAATARR